MPFLGFLDYILIGVFCLLAGAGLVIVLLRALGEFLSFRQENRWRDSTLYYEKDKTLKVLEAQNLCSWISFQRKQNYPWYLSLFFD